MSAPLSHLPVGRIVSIDAFRGLTFVLMLIVNYLAGASGIPPGIHHVGAEVDGMGLADVVFPAFLFAVGMSLPFAINGRLAKGDDLMALQRHIALRAAALIVMGLFMVNAESGYSERAMGMPIAAWSLAFYVAVGLTWGAYRLTRVALDRTLRGAGIALLLVLAASYRGEGGGWMTTQWWGILGCIGWAYLAASIAYQLARASQVLLAIAIALCVLVFVASAAFDMAHVVAMHATHTSIVLAGTLCVLIVFDLKSPDARLVRRAAARSGRRRAAPGLSRIENRRHAALGLVLRRPLQRRFRPALLAHGPASGARLDRHRGTSRHEPAGDVSDSLRPWVLNDAAATAMASRTGARRRCACLLGAVFVRRGRARGAIEQAQLQTDIVRHA
jgi:hypothetical protein